MKRKNKGSQCPDCLHYTLHHDNGHPQTRHSPKVPPGWHCRRCGADYNEAQYEELRRYA